MVTKDARVTALSSLKNILAEFRLPGAKEYVIVVPSAVLLAPPVGHASIMQIALRAAFRNVDISPYLQPTSSGINSHSVVLQTFRSANGLWLTLQHHSQYN
jgi:hypothetical protein